MTVVSIDQILRELALLDPGEVDAELRAVRLAILVEDALGIVLTDNEIVDLQDPASIATALAERGVCD